MIKNKNVYQVIYDFNNLEITIKSKTYIWKIHSSNLDSFNTQLKRVYGMLKEYANCLKESEED